MDLVSETNQDGFHVDTVSDPNPGFIVMEEWKDIKGYEGRYQVSSMGRVKSNLKHQGTNERILKSLLCGSEYHRVGLCKKLELKCLLIHRLVAIAFIPNPKNKPQVNHKNGIKKDNRIDNLEWVTCSENHKHAFATGLKTGVRGEKNHLAKLNDFQVRVIKKSEGLKHKELAKIFNVSYFAIKSIRSGMNWKHI